MTKYKLTTIPGTESIVQQELKSLDPSAEALKTRKGEIDFESEHVHIEKFESLKSALRIQKENKLERNLYRREWRKKFVPAGINPSLAYVMCMIADLKPQEIVLDPFCGGGTIIITALLYFGIGRGLASDVSGKAIDKTMINAHAANVFNKLVCFRSNVSQLRIQQDYVDKIITNLPFGIREQNHESNKKIYDDFVHQCSRILKKGGKVICLTTEKNLLSDAFRKYPEFKFENELKLEQGGLYPSIFVIVKQ